MCPKYVINVNRYLIYLRNSEQPILVADQAGDVDLDDGGQDEHVVLAGKLRGRAVNGMQYE